MKTTRLLRVATVLVFTLVVFSTTVSAQAPNSLAGGNRSSDYQPTTDNPQAGAASRLQNTGIGLQPVSGQSVISQQNLLDSGELKVTVSNNQSKSSTAVADTQPKTDSDFPLLPIIIGSLILLGLVSLFISKQNKTQLVIAPMVDEPEAKTPEITKSPKKQQRKSNHKNRRSKKRKSKK